MKGGGLVLIICICSKQKKKVPRNDRNYDHDVLTRWKSNSMDISKIVFEVMLTAISIE